MWRGGDSHHDDDRLRREAESGVLAARARDRRSVPPDYHIPADVATYVEHSPSERRENVIEAMEGTLWMDEQLRDRDSPTEIIPLVKGITPTEREICYQTFADLGADQCAFYGAQYLTGAPRLTELQEDVTAVADEFDRTEGNSPTILLIGLLSPLYLSRMPERVVAASGLRWLREIEPRSASRDEMRERYATIAEEVADHDDEMDHDHNHDRRPIREDHTEG